MKIRDRYVHSVHRVIIGLISLALLTFGVFAQSKGESWYCAHVKDHARPRADARFSYIDQYDGYYIGKDEQQKVIYLTFDAGYENGNVEKILNVLKERQINAAFFILPQLLRENTSLVLRMFEEGHTVCNHTTHHKDMSAISDLAAFQAELTEIEQLCKEKTGHDMAKYYRPPEGKFSETNLKHAKELGYKTIFWSFAYADWDNQKQMSEAAAKEKILSNLHAGEVMLLHPNSATNAAVLGQVIDACLEQGYRFGTLDELTRQ